MVHAEYSMNASLQVLSTPFCRFSSCVQVCAIEGFNDSPGRTVRWPERGLRVVSEGLAYGLHRHSFCCDGGLANGSSIASLLQTTPLPSVMQRTTL